MREVLSAHDIANQVRMQCSRWNGAFVLVEGDLDARFYGRFVHESGVVVAHGKENAVAALRILVEEAFAGALAIVDQDFWVLGEGDLPALAGLLCTDGRDLEIMLLRSPVLDRLLDSLGSREKLKALRQRTEDPIQILLRAGTEIGYLRWLCERDKHTVTRDPDEALAPDGPLRLKFRDLAFGKFVDRPTLRIDRQKLVKAVADHSRQPVHHERVEAALQALQSEATQHNHDPWDICAGHDLLKLLEIGLCKMFGSCQANALKHLDRFLVAAYDDALFHESKLFASLKAWHDTHSQTPLLRGREA